MGVPRRPQDPRLLERFGSRLRAVREAGGVSQARLADLIGMKPKTISLFENGELAPTLTTVASLARVLHVRVEDLLREDGDPAVASPADAEEAAVLEDYRALGDADRDAIRRVLRGMARR